MFTVNHQTNRISPVKIKTFSELGFIERLDLLALDKVGNLVIIKNKFDESVRDVVWQPLQHAADALRQHDFA
jgi:hypothetical protein